MSKLIMFTLAIMFQLSVFAAQYEILDVRTADEYSSSHLIGAQNIDVLKDDFTQKIEKLDKNKTYKVYCRSGHRAGNAEKIMKDLGFKNVENVGGLQKASEVLKVKCDGNKAC